MTFRFSSFYILSSDAGRFYRKGGELKGRKEEKWIGKAMGREGEMRRKKNSRTESRRKGGRKEEREGSKSREGIKERL